MSEIHSEQDLAQTLRRFAQFRVSGVIVTSGQPPEALVNECVQQHIPVVGINRQPTIPGVDYVCSDNAAGAELAADQLLQRLSALWLAQPPSFHWAGRMRGEAFGRALQTRGVDVERHRRSSPVSKKVTRAGYRLRRSPTRHWRIFCANAQLACGFLDGMRQRGREAPADFQLIGFDNTPTTAQYSYQLTTLHQDVAAIARRARPASGARRRPFATFTHHRVEVTLIHRRTSPFVI